MKWVLQRQTRAGWVTESEHKTDGDARQAIIDMGYWGHINSYRIREKNRKPRKNCRDCKGTGKVAFYGSRPDTDMPAMCECECLRD